MDFTRSMTVLLPEPLGPAKTLNRSCGERVLVKGQCRAVWLINGGDLYRFAVAVLLHNPSIFHNNHMSHDLHGFFSGGFDARARGPNENSFGKVGL